MEVQPFKRRRVSTLAPFFCACPRMVPEGESIFAVTTFFIRRVITTGAVFLHGRPFYALLFILVPAI